MEKHENIKRMIVFDVIKDVLDNSTISYTKLALYIFEKYAKLFREKSFVVDLSGINNKYVKMFLKYSPFMSTFQNNLKSRQILCDHVFNECIECYKLPELSHIKEREERLFAIGNGVIDENGILIVGMAAGFYGDTTTKIGYPFKPSFYFGPASEILRIGFLENLNKIYFTNLAKSAFSESIMNTNNMYLKLYSNCIKILKREIEVLKPQIILAVGTNVFNFLESINIKSTKIFHPSFFLFKHQKQNGIDYYKKINDNISTNIR